MKRWLFVIFSALPLFFCLFGYQPVHMSQEDRLILDPFFKHLVFDQHFGYVLVGEKPVALSSYLSQEPFGNLIFCRKQHKFNLKQSWEILKKYNSKLNSENFLLIMTKASSVLKDPQLENIEIYSIEIVNKKLFLETVEQHLDLFKKTLGNEITPTQLLNQISNGEKSLFEALHYDDGLYGILLGYGTANALTFKRNSSLLPVFDPCYREMAPFTLCLPRPSPSFNSLEEEYAYLQEEFSFFDLKFPLSPFVPPAFRVLKQDEETQLLEKKYRKAHRQLIKMYSRKNALDVTLQAIKS